ncbi:hypothetical protein IGI39_004885 [Enterococcus sp. AZ135]|uniref:helix-turn-helix domain-containing protein n=1 Tax=unclassified Enterococcus TaxID=2608891 RepID=UPI003F27FF2B
MIPKELFNIDDHYKWKIAHLLVIKGDSNCSIGQMSEILGLSFYKTENYLEELAYDFEEIGYGEVLKRNIHGEINSFSLSYLLVKIIRLKYLKNSPIFQIFHNFVTCEISLDSQLARNKINLSRSGAYNYQKKLKTLLMDENIILRTNKLLGQEFELRSFLFEMYFSVFNGIENPFNNQIRKLAREIITYFIHFYGTNLTKTQEIKLTFFLCIWLTRLEFNHVTKERYIEMKKEEFSSYLKKKLKEHFNLNELELDNEIAYFFLFVYLEQIETSFYPIFTNKSVEAQVVSITDSFFKYLINQAKAVEKSLIISKIMEIDFKNINRRWLLYHFKESTFVSEKPIHQYLSISPTLDVFVKEFINKSEYQPLFLNKEEKVKLYYDYYFFIINNISIGNLETPLYICVDFSHGKTYNRYLCQILSSIQNMNIKSETKLSTKTHLYLSDFAVDALPCPQVIWKGPPTMEDWKSLGNLLVTIRTAEK